MNDFSQFPWFINTATQFLFYKVTPFTQLVHQNAPFPRSTNCVVYFNRNFKNGPSTFHDKLRQILKCNPIFGVSLPRFFTTLEITAAFFRTKKTVKSDAKRL